MWLNSPDDLTLDYSDVHIWKQNLEISDLQLKKCFEILNQEEQIKAKRFRFEEHQRRFIAARSTLKIILSRYLTIPPQEIEFTYSSQGKPQLVETLGGNYLQFNLSHSHELAIYGITRDRPIGVDIEYIRRMPDAKRLAQRFFSAQEYAKISLLAYPDLEKSFFQLWTAKEAYLKATGEGIGGGLEQVEVSLGPPLQLINVPNHQCQLHWTISSWTPHPNYQGAVVVSGKKWNLSYWKLPKDRQF